jgi:hypothetical protein
MWSYFVEIVIESTSGPLAVTCVTGFATPDVLLVGLNLDDFMPSRDRSFNKGLSH